MPEKDLEEKFKTLAKKMIDDGFSKKKLKDLLDTVVPKIDTEKRRIEVSIRNIKTVIDFLEGVPKPKILERHGIKKSLFRPNYSKGISDIRAQLELGSINIATQAKLSHPMYEAEQTNESKELWIGYAKEALNQINAGRAYFLTDVVIERANRDEARKIAFYGG